MLLYETYTKKLFYAFFSKNILMLRKNHVITITLLSINLSYCFASKEYEVGLMVGGTSYFGEFNQNKVFGQIRPGGQIFGRYNFYDQLALRASLNYVNIAGDDSKIDFGYNKQRGLKFSNNIVELSAALEFNFRPFRADTKWSDYTPYFTLGAGILMVDAQFEQKFTNNFTLPFGAGIKFNLPGRWSGGIEYKIHKTFRDDLDGLTTQLYDQSGKYTNKQIANLRSDDWYSLFGIYFTYKFKRTESCCAYSQLIN